MGGDFAWPQDEPWPACDEHGTPLVSVLQLTAQDVPELGFPERTNLFQMLWCPFDHPDLGWGPAPTAYWRQRGEGSWLVAPTPPDVGQAQTVPMECALFPERVREYPSVEDPALVDRLDEWLALNASSDLERLGIEDGPLYQYHFSVAPGTKVGGYPNWIQYPVPQTCECGSTMDYLLTVESAEFDGAYQRWMSLGERWVWESDYRSRDAIQRPAGLMLADMGNLNVFVCRNCDHQPIQSDFQSS